MNSNLLCTPFSKSFLPVAIAIAFVATTGVAISPSHAGSRPLELIFVNMTPDADSSKESTSCVNAIKRAFTEDDAEIRKLGETKTRTATGIEKGGAHFLTWKPKQFATLVAGHPKHGDSDAILLVDCRPKQKTLDILLLPNSGRKITFSLRGQELSKKLLKNIANRAWMYSGDGFEP